MSTREGLRTITLTVDQRGVTWRKHVFEVGEVGEAIEFLRIQNGNSPLVVKMLIESLAQAVRLAE